MKIFEKKYGEEEKNFIEVALKEAKTEEGSNVFFSIAKGYYDREGNKKYKNSLGFNASEELKKFVIESFSQL